MIAAISDFFVTGIRLTSVQRLAMMLPLCLSVAIVYKATRCERLRDLPLAALALWITIVVGMYAVGIGLWAAFEIMV